MADKFPEIDASGNDGDFGGSDFLSREKELVGDEFTTDQDKSVLQEEESDDEINEFKEQFPEFEHSAPAGKVGQGDEKEGKNGEEEEEFEGFSSGSKDLSSSEPIKEWKQRRDLEIEEREKVSRQKKQDLLAKAQQTIDDFYENYNLKKEKHSQTVVSEQEKFLAKRDGFLKNGTLWDRVNELIDNVGELSKNDSEAESSRDKTRFKEILKKLKGKADVPGAGGYQE
ncbi:uncharacterized protein LODBEIA_P48640 [Lodderomyces beijingensis]|uniref:Clathrin light chain n=1 Tax=Lodderomyces beijingensis TaxID=1775926 RepID=A0ABP0ZTV5_9ASCO